MADNLVMEEREEFMVSPTGNRVRLRTAHFLTPSVTSIDGPVAAPTLDSLSPAAAFVAKYKDLPLKVNFLGWRYPKENWKTWVDQMHSLHHSTWKRAGIVDAIRNSTCSIHRYDDLILGFVEKWCPTTNSFVFPWGEATITLEDMMVLGGYSVLGKLVLSPPVDGEMEQIVNKLLRARSSFSHTKAKKADQNRWITKFMGSQSEIEHEAFLAYWLSKFVFPLSRNTIGNRNILSIAVHLARGTKIALAPAVLASIYESLTSLKAAVTAAKRSGTNPCQNDVLEVTVSAPLALVQVWIWERFPSLRPKPNSIGEKEPRLARWHNVKKLDIGGMLLTIDSAAENFQWRPYISNVFGRMIYMDKAYWALVDSNLDEDLEGLVRCLRTSELVSLEGDCIEQYLPHRVARQFGMDQDLPGHVARVNVNPKISWRDYCRPIRDAKLYVTARLSEPHVTSRYLKWWKKLNLGWRGITEPGVDGKSTSEGSKEELVKDLFDRKLEVDIVPPPPGFSPKWKERVEAGASGDSGISDQFQDGRNANFRPQQVAQRQSPLSSTANNGVEAGLSEKGSSRSSKRKFVESSSWKISDYNSRVSPPVFTPQHRQEKASDSGIGIEKTVAGASSSGSHGNIQSQEGKDHSSSEANNGNIQEETLLVEPAESEASEGPIDETEIKISGPSRVQGSTSEAPGIGLEERIRNIEKMCALLKAGKLVCLMKNPDNS